MADDQEDEATVVAELVAELMLEHPELSLEECQAAVSESLGNRKVVASRSALDNVSAATSAPAHASAATVASTDGGGDDEDAAVDLLRQRYAESQAKQEVQRALAALDELDSDTAGQPDSIASTSGSVTPPGPEVPLTPRADRPAHEVDDSWLMADVRQAARQALSEEERAEVDEALYAAAREGFPKECEYLIGKGAAFDGWKSKNNATAIHAASANGHRACVAVLLEAGGTKAKMSKNKFRQSPSDLAKKYKHHDVVSLLQNHVAI